MFLVFGKKGRKITEKLLLVLGKNYCGHLVLVIELVTRLSEEIPTTTLASQRIIDLDFMAHLAHLHLTPFQFELLTLLYGETDNLRLLLEGPVKACLAVYCLNHFLLWAQVPPTGVTRGHLWELGYLTRAKLRTLSTEVRQAAVEDLLANGPFPPGDSFAIRQIITALAHNL